MWCSASLADLDSIRVVLCLIGGSRLNSCRALPHRQISAIPRTRMAGDRALWAAHRPNNHVLARYASPGHAVGLVAIAEPEVRWTARRAAPPGRAPVPPRPSLAAVRGRHAAVMFNLPDVTAVVMFNLFAESRNREVDLHGEVLMRLDPADSLASPVFSGPAAVPGAQR